MTKKMEEEIDAWPTLKCFGLHDKLSMVRDSQQSEQEIIDVGCQITQLSEEEYKTRIQIGEKEFEKMSAEVRKTKQTPTNANYIEIVKARENLMRFKQAFPAETKGLPTVPKKDPLQK